jgi:hypothetical protein
MGAWYHDSGTLSSGSDGPFTEKSSASNLLQRVGGRAGTAAPQGAVCELPNPVVLRISSVGTSLCEVSQFKANGMAFALDLHPIRCQLLAHAWNQQLRGAGAQANTLQVVC